MRYLVIAAIALALTGCAATRMNRVSLGMTKAQVLDELGNPNSTSAKGGAEYLTYSFYERVGGPYLPYYVRIIDGKVESYGKVGDFDSTQPPTSKVEIDARVTTNK